ncbi:MAG: hypothetical protein ACRDJO_04750 [Actinomycetota bacterium]
MSAADAFRRLGRSTLAVALVATGLFLPRHEAAASAQGCVLSENQPRSCVKVRGAGTFVEWAQGGVGLFSYSSVHGHFQVYGTDFDVSTPDTVYDNNSPKANDKWGPEIPVDRDLPHDSKVCAIFWQRRGPGDYQRHSPACVTIER